MRKVAFLIVLCGLISAAAAACPPPQDSAPKTSPVVSRETYDRVLDILFPRDSPGPVGNVWAVVLRFKSGSKSESQVVIRRGVDKVQVIEYASPDGSIYGKLNDILSRGGKEDAAEMAKTIRVERREVRTSLAQVNRWYAALSGSMAGTTKTLGEKGKEFDKTGGESFVLDGAVYELWYEHGTNKLAFSLYDVEVDKADSDGEFALVRWMNGVRRGVGRLKMARASR